MTYADIEALPAHVVGEILGGELVVSPRPAPRHTRAASALGMVVGGPFQLGVNGPGGWWIFDEPELHLGADVLVPDLAGWRRERLPELPDTAWFDLAPDWVCEVLSPSTQRIDRVKKLHIYGREAVQFVWLIDPVAPLLEVYERQDDVWLRRMALDHPKGPVRLPPFEEVELDLALVWGPAPPEEAEDAPAEDTPAGEAE